MSENQLSVLPQDLNLPITSHADDKAWGDVITSSTFLPRMQLFGGNSQMVKEGKIGIGRWGLQFGKDRVEDLTASVDIVPLSWRFKAMRIQADAVTSIHNPKHPEWAKIVEESEQSDSGCMYGVEFLVWLPSQKAFATLYLSSKTSRREGPALKQCLTNRCGATMKTNLIKKGKYTWHGPVVVPTTVPMELPTPEEMIEQAERFANPKDTEVETVDPATAGVERDR